jgi:DNA-binding CsgD family transcriptional regulator
MNAKLLRLEAYRPASSRAEAIAVVPELRPHADAIHKANGASDSQDNFGREHWQWVVQLAGACHDVGSSADFATNIHPIVKRLLPHQGFACGVIGLADGYVRELVNLNLPCSLRDRSSRQAEPCPVFGRWRKTRSPVYFDGLQPQSEEHSSWPVAFRGLGLSSIVFHGMTDLFQETCSYFEFANVDGYGPREERLLQLIVPQLHVGLTSSSRREERRARATPSGKPLSPREREILGWMCSGKLSAEIAMILGISIWTVKVHVRHVMEKLMVSNRSGAVASALALGLISPSEVDEGPRACDARAGMNV